MIKDFLKVTLKCQKFLYKKLLNSTVIILFQFNKLFNDIIGIFLNKLISNLNINNTIYQKKVI